mmetsp:Transcript_63421/g.117956  ORF Transcript_63421/g.117956 Transcript_63421/m.117956 type:complete len:460 (-) Transcript_63421:113-1492(-)
MAMSRPMPTVPLVQDPCFTLSIQQVEANGNSQFAALSHQSEGTEKRHRRVREQIVNFIHDNREYFEPICKAQEKDFDSYIRYMRLLQTPGDEITLSAASRALEAVVVVLFSNGRHPAYYFDPQMQLGPNARHLFLMCCEDDIHCNHYNSVVFTLSSPTAVVLEEKEEELHQDDQVAPSVEPSSSEQSEQTPSHAERTRTSSELSEMPRDMWKVCCKCDSCNREERDDIASVAFCTVWQQGRCEAGEAWCKHRLCHNTRGGYKGQHVRRVKRSWRGRNKQAQTTDLALMEQSQQALLTASGWILKNCCYDTVDAEQDESRSLRSQRARSCDTLRSKDPRCRASCGCCIHDEKLRRERVAKLYNGRVAMLAVLGMLDLYTGSEVAPDLQHMMAFTREYFRPRNSGGVFDPLGLLLLCEKDLCKHWLRGECKSGEKCKFAHCHPGDFSKDGMKSQPAVTNQR